LINLFRARASQVVGAATLAAALGLVSFSAHGIELKAGYGLQQNSHWGDAATAFASVLEEKSGGKFTVEQFPDSQLGGERAMIEGLQLGTVDLVFTSTGPVGNFVPSTLVFDVPFLFRDYAHARQVQDGPIGDQLLADFEPAGLVALGWGYAGFRHFTNSKGPILSPAELAGLKHRVMENDVHIQAFTTLKSLPTPMAFPELYTSLQNGTLDGQENPISVTIAGKLFEVQKHMSLTSHALTNAVILTSPMVWNELSEEEKGWFREATVAAKEAMRSRVESDDIEGLEFLKQNGVQVEENVDREAFRAALAPAYDAYKDRFGDLIDQITAQ
jgi:tripartite ATP-independent transporter DctP family solute receptor